LQYLINFMEKFEIYPNLNCIDRILLNGNASAESVEPESESQFWTTRWQKRKSKIRVSEKSLKNEEEKSQQ
jgi:hypothetical protein